MMPELDQGQFDYRGYRIFPNTKTKWCRNPVSGHEWPTYEEVKGWHIIGPKAWSDVVYYSLSKAKEHIDFLVKFFGTPKEVQ